jgi:peptidoglycan hydrolase-like protein with peptidoglycan-binding domain
MMAKKIKHKPNFPIVAFAVMLFLSTILLFGTQTSVSAQENTGGSFPKSGEWEVETNGTRFKLILDGDDSSVELEIPNKSSMSCGYPDIDDNDNFSVRCQNRYESWVFEGELPIIRSSTLGTFDLRDDENYRAAQPDKVATSETKQSLNSTISQPVSSFPKTGEWKAESDGMTLRLTLNGDDGGVEIESPSGKALSCDFPNIDDNDNISFSCQNQFSRYSFEGKLPLINWQRGTFDLRDDENYQAAQPNKDESTAVAAKAKHSPNSSIPQQVSLFPKTGEWAVGNGHYRLELALSANGSSASLTALSPAARDGVCEEPTVDEENYVEFYCRNQFYRLKISGTLPVLSAGAFGTFDFSEDENYRAAKVEIEKQAAEKKRKDEEKRQVAKAEKQKAEQRKKEEVRLAAEAARKKQEAEQEAENALLAAELKRKQELEQARIAAEEEQKRKEEEKRNKLAEARKNGKTIEQLLGADGRIAVQTALKMEGLLKGDADGVFGAGTRKALKAYQSNNGTLETGYLTADEAAELREIAKSSAEFIAAEEERKRKAAEIKKKREETKKRLAAEAKRKREEEKARKAAEAERKAEEVRIAAEQERVRKEEETRKIAEAKKRKKEMRKQLAAEARQKRKAEKAKKAADAEAKRVAAEKAKRIAKEKAELAVEEAKRIAKEKAELAANEERKRKAKLRKKAKQELKRKLAAYREAPETKPLFDGDNDDIVFLLNESDRPLNAIRNLKGDVVFEDGKADICRVKKLTLDADYKVALLNELEGKGIKDFAKGFAATACGDLEKSEADLVVFQRGAFLNSKFEEAEAVLLQLQSQEFSIFYTSSSAAYKAEIASRGDKAKEVQAGVEAGSLKGFGMLILDNKSKGVCAVKTDKQEAHTHLIETVTNELPIELQKIVDPINFGSLDRTFISLKRKKCRFLFASSENLKSVHAALKRDKIASVFHHQWIDETRAEPNSKTKAIKTRDASTEIALAQQRNEEEVRKQTAIEQQRKEKGSNAKPLMKADDSKEPTAVVNSQQKSHSNSGWSHAEFVQKNGDFSRRYKSASNDLQKTAIKNERNTWLEQTILQNGVMVNEWSGTIGRLSTDKDGDASVTIQLSEVVSLKTIIEISGITTTLKYGSNAWTEVSQFSEGDRVIFSGKFLPDDLGARYHLKEESFTEEGAMTAPEWGFAFTSFTK